MGGIVGGVTDAIGLTDHKGEKRAAKAAAQANAQSLAMSKEQVAFMKEQLQFQKDQYTDWKNIYGDVQTNLGNYYKNLGEEKIVTLGLQNQQMGYQAAVKEIERDFAQRGLTGSGAEMAVKSNATFQNAEARAKIRTEAPQKVAEQKMQFLGVGLGQGTQMLGVVANAASGVNQAYSTGVNARTSMAQSYLGQQTQLSTNNTDAMGQIIGAGMGWASGGTSNGTMLR